MNIGLYDKGKYRFKCPACEAACNGRVKTENSRRVIMVTKDLEETAELGTRGRQDTVGTDDEIACPACGEVCCLTGVVVMGGSLRCAGCGYVGEAEFEVRIRWHGPEVAESTEPAPCPRCGAAHADYDEDVEAVGSGAEVDEPAPCAGAAMSANRVASIVMGLAWYGHSAYWGRYVRDSLKKYYPDVDWVPLLEAYVKDRDSPPGIGSPKSFPDGVCPYCGRGEMAERGQQ